MRFDLDGLQVFFPYDFLYKEQYEYMLRLKYALDNKGDALLEMPTGTGKTVCLIALITSYQYQFPTTGKLIYCTRTVPEMTKCMDEIKKVIAYREKELGMVGGKVLALCLSSRRNLCIHPDIIAEGDRETVDTLCRNRTASWVRNRILGDAARGNQGCAAALSPEALGSLCEYYENYNRDGSHAGTVVCRTLVFLHFIHYRCNYSLFLVRYFVIDIPSGIYALDDLKELGRQKKWCPYFLTRHLINHASILVYNYQYMLDPKVANIVSRELEAESIVVFDEAHNIDNVCIEALSVTVDKRMINQASSSVNRLQSKVSELKATDANKLRREYEQLVAGLRQQQGIARNSVSQPSSSSSSSSSNIGTTAVADVENSLVEMTDAWSASPLLSSDILEEAIPGNIRKAEHFVVYLKKLVVYIKTLFSVPNVENRLPALFLQQLREQTNLEIKPLQFTYTRLNSLLRTLEITSLDDFTALQEIANFVTLISTYRTGFSVIIDPHGSSITAGIVEPLVHLCCLDASLAIKPVLERFQSVIITSGTLSPIDLYPKLLNFTPIVSASLPMSTFRPCLLPLIVTRGSDQLALSTKFEVRDNPNVLRNYALLLLSVCSSVPDGVVAFFTSYIYMERVLSAWDSMGMLREIMNHKLVFLETKDVVETTLALDNYRRACDCGRGAVFFSVARGKVAEGIDFDGHYGRCVLLFGVPYQYTLSQVLKARLSFMRETYNIRDDDFLTFDALRQSAQCVGRVIRSKSDYGAVVLADSRFQRNDTRSRLPPWVKQFLRESSLNLTTDVAVEQIRQFSRQMAQPIEEPALRSILLNEQEVARFSKGYRWRDRDMSVGGQARADFEAIPVPIDPQDVETSVVNAMIVANSDGAEEEQEEYFAEMHGYLDESQNNKAALTTDVEVEALSEQTISEYSQRMKSSLFLFDDILDT
jgi:DNA excision repair protein ERCC-2